MTSERAARANRRNARASSGPRTAAGKARSGQNARKHGLSAADPNPEVEAEIEALALLFAGEQVGDAGVLTAARAVAEAHIQLQRVKAYRLAVFRSGIPPQPQQEKENDHSIRIILMAIFMQIEIFDRHERRARSRRKFAVRRLMDLIGQ